MTNITQNKTPLSYTHVQSTLVKPQANTQQKILVKKNTDTTKIWRGQPIRWKLKEVNGKFYNVPFYDMQVYGEGTIYVANGNDLIIRDHPDAQAYLIALEVRPAQARDVLPHIPNAMDNMGWKIAARMMRHWFSIKPAWKMTDKIKHGDADPMTLKPSQYNDQIIKMDWVLHYKRVRKAFDELYSKWATKKGKGELKKKLIKAGWKSGMPTFRLAYNIRTARELDSICQVNFRSFGSKSDTLDDLFGALGIANFKLAVVGTVKHIAGSPAKNIFTVERVGIYIRDTYDFRTDEIFEEMVPLGIWSRDRLLSKRESAAYVATASKYYNDFVSVYNRDFQDWQDNKNEGGDFVVYSDVKWLVPDPSWQHIELP